MAPGAFSILAPFMRRKVKKYERLETEDPEKKKQEATMEELTRINVKIVSIFLSYVASWTNKVFGLKADIQSTKLLRKLHRSLART